jgi:small basic protein
MLPLLAVLFAIVGFVVVYFVPGFQPPLGDQQYLSLAALAGLDSLVGGLRAGTEGKFQSNVFITGFVMNTLLAVFLAYLGERLGQDLGLAAVVLLGGRTFVNLSIIRRHWLDTMQRPGTSANLAAAPSGTGGPELESQ